MERKIDKTKRLKKRGIGILELGKKRSEDEGRENKKAGREREREGGKRGENEGNRERSWGVGGGGNLVRI